MFGYVRSAGLQPALRVVRLIGVIFYSIRSDYISRLSRPQVGAPLIVDAILFFDSYDASFFVERFSEIGAPVFNRLCAVALFERLVFIQAVPI